MLMYCLSILAIYRQFYKLYIRDLLRTTIISETRAHSIESDCSVHETRTGTWEIDQEEIPTLL